MTRLSIDRKLWHMTDDGRVEISQAVLPERTEPLVILGEAGMGKSYLLDWFATLSGYKLCTARQLINRFDPKSLLGDAKVLVIDGLDEVSSQKEGDAVDLVLRQLGVLGYPQFVISCRISDWRSATGCEAIQGQYFNKPLELHLEPFTDSDAMAFLAETLGSISAEIVVNHFNDRGLNGLLGNPQTLKMIASVAVEGNLPETRGELFARAIEDLRKEHNDLKSEVQPAREVGFDAAGAAFAGLIITGSEAIVRISAANVAEGELQLAELLGLPGGEAISVMLGTRLFKAAGADRFNYVHRTIGEYLGAQWLVKQADTPRKRRRLLSLFHGHGLVPASLRGIHAWLAQDPLLAKDVISADPMGVIDYGDADILTVDKAQLLIHSLELLAADNPHFRDWKPYSVRGIVQPRLVDDLRRLIAAKETPFGLRMLILESIKGSRVAADLTENLRCIALDQNEIFAIRQDAIEALDEQANVEEWVPIVRTLYGFGDEDSVRLGIELIDDIGYEIFDDDLIVKLIIAYATDNDRTIGTLITLERNLPDLRLEGILDCLVIEAKKLGESHKRPGDNVLTDLVYHLLMRILAGNGVTAEKLWSWIEPFDASAGYHRDTRQAFSEYIQSNNNIRQAIQRLVLLDLPGDDDIWKRSFNLHDQSYSFTPNSEDILKLLDALDPENRSDERWREVIQLINHDRENGSEVRNAAKIFAVHRPDLLEWIDKLSDRLIPDWKIKQEERDRKHRAGQAIKRAEQRKYYLEHIDRLRSGEYGVIVNLAAAYLKIFNDVGQNAPAHERISEWLGADIADAAHEGFEAFIMLDPPLPSARDIAESLAESKHYEAGYIIVAALAERYRKSLGFDDLPDERLMAGLFELHRTAIEHFAGIVGLSETIKKVIKMRGVLEETMRLLLEPQLEARRQHVDGLHGFMRSEDDSFLANKLAAEWLMRFPDLPNEPESELIERLMRSERFDELRVISANRIGLADIERKRNWCAISLLIDFENFISSQAATVIESELLWHIRDRASGGRFSNNIFVMPDPLQLEWIINNFRVLWPKATHPSGSTWGDRNSWDASDFINNLIRRLGSNPSDNASIALQRLHDAPVDGYSEWIKIISAEQKRARVETAYVPPKLNAMNAILRNQAPASASDLQVFVLDELAIVQAKISSDDAESWRGFYDDNGVPFQEERCRDHLLGLLRQGSRDVVFDPEAHVAGDKEVDIACSVGMLRMPIEIKGQWHPQLWHGADMQLDSLYTGDWRADGRGIYLALWFGNQESPKSLTSPGRGVKRPETACELRDMLVARSQSAKEKRVDIFVLDLTRPQK